MPVSSAARRQRFCVYHPPQRGDIRGAVLYAHPFAEESNKARRMAALQARALARAGYAVLQIDLLGCGDSSGDFGDATWQHWIDDLAFAGDWLLHRHPAPLWLWGLRAGCLLAAAAARHVDSPCDMLFWQPPATGRPLFQQFLRLELAAHLKGGDAKGAMATLRDRLLAQQPVEVAGYRLSASIAKGLSEAALAPVAGCRRLIWLEVTGSAEAVLLPASQTTVQAWRQSGVEVHARAVTGPAFWQTVETEEVPALLEATLMMMGEPALHEPCIL